MLVGVPKETKDNEFRVSVIPATVEELVRRGHHVLVEAGAGTGAGLADAAYESAGAEIVATAEAVFERAELIVKIKEPLHAERKRLQRGQVPRLLLSVFWCWFPQPTSLKPKSSILRFTGSAPRAFWFSAPRKATSTCPRRSIGSRLGRVTV